MSDNIRSIKRTHLTSNRSASRRFVRAAGRLLMIVLALALLGSAGLLLFRVSDEARSIFQFIARYSAYAYAVQLAMTVGLWLGWAKLVALMVSHGVVPEHARQALLNRRATWCGVLLALQLLLLASTVVQPA